MSEPGEDSQGVPRRVTDVHDLSLMVAPEGTITFEGVEKLRLNDYAICQLLGPYILTAITYVERTDCLVRKVILTPESVRAFFPEPNGPDAPMPEFVEIKLPKGVYERAVDLSCGPLSPFPVASPSEEVKLFLGRLHQLAFPEMGLDGSIPKHLLLSPTNFADVRKWLGRRMDPCTTRDELMAGFQGILYETEEPPPGPRSVKVWITRILPKGAIATAVRQPPPHWELNGSLKIRTLSRD